MDIRSLIDRYSNKEYMDRVVSLRRYLHQNPELSGAEHETRDFICTELDKLGIPWRYCGTQGNGILATLEGSGPGKTIILRADMDALPVNEETGLPYASRNEGVMHACGHDAHMAMLLTAAAMLKDLQEELCGTVRFAFQPAEESEYGADWMVGDGALDGADGCFAMHVWSEIPSGKFSCEPGPRWAAAREFCIKVHGKGGHGAQPQDCVDAIVIGSEIVQAYQTLVSRHFPPTEPVVVSIGAFNAGSVFNVIPGEAILRGTTRCFNAEIHKELPVLLQKMATDIAHMHGGTIEYNEGADALPIVNDEAMTSIVKEVAVDVLGEGAAVDIGQTMIGEDFSYFIDKIPGAMMRLGIGNESCGAVYNLHHNKFTVDEDALIKGALMHAAVALRFNRG